MKKRSVLDCLESLSQTCRVDRDNAVIPRVKILGTESRNKRVYPQEVMRAALPQYEGASVCIDHPAPDQIRKVRPTLAQWGWLENCTAEPDGVYGDLHYYKNHPSTDALLEIAERRPDKFGLSHNAECEWRQEGDKQVVESVLLVRSVDLVQRPATTSSLYESENEAPMSGQLKTTIKAILTAVPPATKMRKQLLQCLEMEGMSDMGDVPVTLTTATPDATTSDLSPDEQVYEAFRTAIIAFLDDASLTSQEKVAKIEAALEAYETSFGGQISAPPADDTTTGGTATESVASLQAQITAMKRETKARDVLESADVKASPARIKAVCAVLESVNEVEELIASFPKRSSEATDNDSKGRQSSRPRTSAPANFLESQQGSSNAGSAVPSYKDFVQSVK